MAEVETTSFTRRHLPHWRVLDRPYFVTFRLKNTIPENIVKELHAERIKLEKAKANQEEIDKFERYEFIKIELILDNLNNDLCYLKNPKIASLVMDSFNFIEKQFHWVFPCLTVMPNHVHCLAVKRPDTNVGFEIALGSLKQHVSHESNKILGTKGRMWCDENYDHWCRTPESVEKFIEYIKNNPVKAGLVNNWRDWKWTVSRTSQCGIPEQPTKNNQKAYSGINVDQNAALGSAAYSAAPNDALGSASYYANFN